MNVQIIRFVDIWLKRLCLKICNTARCNKELVSQEHMLIIMRQSHVICEDMRVILAYVQVQVTFSFNHT